MANDIMNRIQENIGEAKAYIPAHYFIKLLKVAKAEAYDNEYGEGHYELEKGEPKLEGTRGEHWSPKWPKITKKYLLSDGSPMDPEKLPEGEYISIQTNPDREERKKSVTWVIDPALISIRPFQVGDLTIDPLRDMLCMGGDEKAPTTEWGVWPVKKEIFADTYELL